MSNRDRALACFPVLCGILLLAHLAMSAGVQAQQNSCVRCHSKLSNNSFYGVKSHSWIGSIHQQHGVTCNKCHRGNPEAATKAQAHIGVLPSSNPRSSVYFKNVPATCGKCHGAEYYMFQKSLHYKILESTGRGPSCVTCHGSMVTKVLTPDNLVAVCARCHNQRMGIPAYVPQKARAILLLIRQSSALLAADKKLYSSPEYAKAAPILRRAEVYLQAAKMDWHRFDLNTVTKHLEQFHDTLEKLPSACSCSCR